MFCALNLFTVIAFTFWWHIISHDAKVHWPFISHVVQRRVRKVPFVIKWFLLIWVEHYLLAGWSFLSSPSLSLQFTQFNVFLAFFMPLFILLCLCRLYTLLISLLSFSCEYSDSFQLDWADKHAAKAVYGNAYTYRYKDS